MSVDVPVEPLNVEETDDTDEQSVREACDELKDHFNHRLVESLLKATRHSLDTMRRRFFSRLIIFKSQWIENFKCYVDKSYLLSTKTL